MTTTDMTTTDKIMPSIQKVLAIIEEREGVYKGTWKYVGIKDSLAVARVKTLRASEGIQDDVLGEKVEDDVLDAIAYLLFTHANLMRMKELMAK